MLIRNIPCYVYDIEVFKNAFHTTIYNTESKELYKFEVSERKNQINELCKFFLTENCYFVGYNNIHYDNPIINYCIEFFYNKEYSVSAICQSLYNLTRVIFDKERKEEWKKWKYATAYKTLDVLTMLYSQALRVSLKEMQVTMQYHNVQDFTGDFHKEIRVEDIDKMIEYNINDVLSTAALLNRCKDEVELRIDIEDKHEIDCLSKDGVGLGVEILEQRYLQATGLKRWDLKDLRSPMDMIPLKDIILPEIKFNSSILQDLLTEMKDLTVSASRNGWNKKFIFHGRKISIGVGGIHSINKSEIIIPDEKTLLLDTDARSLYPSLILKWGFIPSHLDKQAFSRVYNEIYDERVVAKAAGRTLEDLTKKLALNSATGNYQNKYSWLYSPFAVMQIRINGQLLLLMLAESLIEIGCNIIQYNTDGLFLTCPKDKKDEYDIAITKFEEISKLVMETKEYKAMYQYAINDYFAVPLKGKLQEKGMFITKVKLGKGLTPKIIPKAIQAYLLYNIPIENTIRQATDIQDFLMSEKTGNQWDVIYNNIKQQHTNRFYASTNGAYLRKVQSTDSKDLDKDDLFYIEEIESTNSQITTCQNMLSESGVTILNKFDEKSIEDRKINYRYYLRECYKIIEELKPRQLSLF